MQAEIKGSTMPVLEVSLQQGEAVITPHGELAWMTTSIRMSQTMNAGGGGRGGLLGGDLLPGALLTVWLRLAHC